MRLEGELIGQVQTGYECHKILEADVDDDACTSNCKQSYHWRMGYGEGRLEEIYIIPILNTNITFRFSFFPY
jgi:hypothetical protein